MFVLTIMEEGTDKETQGSPAIFTNSGPWKFCHWCQDNSFLAEGNVYLQNVRKVILKLGVIFL